MSSVRAWCRAPSAVRMLNMSVPVDAPQPSRVILGPGQLFVVPKGTPHQPYSPDGAEVLLIEPSTTVNTGDTPSDLTAQRRVI
jgi:mannose-6-phosphate isomerase-like protein (cupin superfamily)